MDKFNFVLSRLLQNLWTRKLSTLVSRAIERAISYQKVFKRSLTRMPTDKVTVEINKLGPDIRGYVYIQLANFPDHYLVVIITDDQFRFALITTEMSQNLPYPRMLIMDICWLVYDRLRQESLAMARVRDTLNPDVRIGMKKKRELNDMERQPGFPECVGRIVSFSDRVDLT